MANTSAMPGSVMPPTNRLMSVDALRGFDMFWIIGADALVYALNRMTKSRPTEILADQLEHAEWQGYQYYDMIYPLFVFIMRVSIVFSLTKIIRQEGRAAALKRIVRRFVLLYVVALIYSGGFSTAWPDIRLMGVLNRIALCYFFGGIIFCFCNPARDGGDCGGVCCWVIGRCWPWCRSRMCGQRRAGRSTDQPGQLRESLDDSIWRARL